LGTDRIALFAVPETRVQLRTGGGAIFHETQESLGTEQAVSAQATDPAAPVVAALPSFTGISAVCRAGARCLFMITEAVTAARAAVIGTRLAVLSFVTGSVSTPGVYLLPSVDILHVGDIRDIRHIQSIRDIQQFPHIFDIRRVRRDIGDPRIIHQIEGIQPPVAFRPVPSQVFGSRLIVRCPGELRVFRYAARDKNDCPDQYRQD